MQNNLNTKKQSLKNLILNSDKDYDLVIYRLIDKVSLDFVIPEIDHKNSKNIGKVFISPEEQFISLLDRLIRLFKNLFLRETLHQELILTDFINSNEPELKEYLLLNLNINNHDDSKVALQYIYKIFTNSIRKNAKYLQSIQELFTKNKIDLTENNLNQIVKIEQIISDITKCNNNDYNILYLFINIDYVTNKKQTDLKDQNIKDIRKSVIEDFAKKYDILLHYYEKRKNYLKYIH